MSRPNVEHEGAIAGIEDGLFYLREQRAFGAKRNHLVRILEGLEDADRIERERVHSRVTRAREELRDAEEDLARVDEIQAQKAEIRAEWLQLEAEEEKSAREGERQLARDAKRAGFIHIDHDLSEAARLEEVVGPGGLKKIVASRRRRHPQLSVTEAEAI